MIYLAADFHFGHCNVIKYCGRPFADVNEMDEALVLNWNSIVKPEDTVYCLGDMSMSFVSISKFAPRLMGRKLLVPGNHDFCHSYHKKSRNPENREKWNQEYRNLGFEILPEQTTMEIEGIGTVNLCHHPYTVDGDDFVDKYAKWRPVDDGHILIHGHVHEKFLTKLSPKGTLMVNVGVDVHNFRPISQEELVKIIEANKIK